VAAAEDVATAENVVTAKNVVTAELVVPADLRKHVFGDNVFGKPTIAVSFIVAKI